MTSPTFSPAAVITARRTTKASKPAVAVYLDGRLYHVMAGARAARATHVIVQELPETHPYFASRGAYPVIGGGMGLRSSAPKPGVHGAGTRFEHSSFGIAIEDEAGA